ncbi:PIG-L deacetylase family protein [uncultured Lamprocystis sp.]|jgi:LmbE family N-acetylglucosaminyl deacetylase|uniref:PIG-L deacetylase family protein n=1 Tax=uncultured Lamprocystis sp. TaxID=543132 RepID=UPI0025E2A540|nr:PIG-L family deacetylase [uncultured Lamprocystis sp.]
MRTLVVAPHPDDETLGLGGTLLRRRAEGAEVAWVIVTGISVATGWDEARVARRAEEIRRVAERYRFSALYEMGLPTTRLDQVPTADLVSAFSGIFKEFQPQEVFVPHPSDVHSDHRIVFQAVAGCTKWFRYPSVNRVLAYETLSETDFVLDPQKAFRPNVFVDIGGHLEEKLAIFDLYASELGAFPFPRSHEAVRALATLRGAAAGYKAAESFGLLRERS